MNIINDYLYPLKTLIVIHPSDLDKALSNKHYLFFLRNRQLSGGSYMEVAPEVRA